MSLRYRAIQLFIRRWPVPHVSRRTFANGNAKYNEAPLESINGDELEPTVNDSDVLWPTTPIRTGELARRARILQTWQDQLELTQLEEEIGNGLEQTQDSGPRSVTTNPPIWLPDRPVVRKVMTDETNAAIAGAVRYYLKPRKGKALAKAEAAAAADPMLQYALSPEYVYYRGEILDVALDEAVQIGKGNFASGGRETRRRDIHNHRSVDGEKERETWRKQAEEDFRRHAQSIGLRRNSQMQHSSLTFVSAVIRWKTSHLPPRTHDTHSHTYKALLGVTSGWVDSLGPKFSKRQILDIANEVAVFKHVMAERYNRRLQQRSPRLRLQNLLFTSCSTIEIQLKEILRCLEKLLEDESFRESPIGKDCEVYAQKIDSWIMQYDAMSEDFIHRTGRYLETLSDEEVARKLQSSNARAASATPPYFDPAHYSGTIDPVFWPRTPRLGI